MASENLNHTGSVLRLRTAGKEFVAKPVVADPPPACLKWNEDRILCTWLPIFYSFFTLPLRPFEVTEAVPSSPLIYKSPLPPYLENPAFPSASLSSLSPNCCYRFTSSIVYTHFAPRLCMYSNQLCSSHNSHRGCHHTTAGFLSGY